MTTFDPIAFLAGQAAHQEAVRKLLEEIREATKEAPRFSSANQASDQVVIRVVRVVTSGTPVQGPSIPVPKGFPVTVRQRQHAGAPVGRVAASRNAIANNFERVQLQDGESVDLRVSNLNKLWFDSDTANTDFELIVET